MELENIKKIRTPIRRSATSLIKTIQSEIGKGTEMSLDIIQESLAKLLDKEMSLRQLVSDIEKLCNVEDLEKEIEDRESYKDNILTWKLRANKALNKLNTETANNDNRSIDKTEIRNTQCTIYLPRLEISKYEGNILKFEDFWSQSKFASI